MKRELGVGYCGLVCALCSGNTDCIGCKKGCYLGKDKCKNYQCCINKGYDSCYECVEFPCQDSILHKKRVSVFCEFIGVYGEEKILDCLEENERQGIRYHGDNNVGDYDKLTTKEEIFNLILNSKVE